jgi:DNA topoisomerase-1
MAESLVEVPQYLIGLAWASATPNTGCLRNADFGHLICTSEQDDSAIGLHQGENHGQEIQQAGATACQKGDARKKAWNVAKWSVGKKSNEPPAGDCDRALQSAQGRRPCTGEKALTRAGRCCRPDSRKRASRLRHQLDNCSGISRIRGRSGFSFRYSNGRAVKSPSVLKRIKKLAIPPAWSKVWISLEANNHLQATGIDSKGRKQYLYHARWRQRRDGVKYDRLIAFGKALPTIRRQIANDLRLSGLPRRRVLAAVVRLLELTLVRIGNDEYACANDSYGLTTLHDRHATVSRGRVRFEFRGKSGVKHEVEIRDRFLARLVSRCRDVKGRRLFQFLADDATPHAISSADVNEYLREISGQNFTAKDFRTWAATALVAKKLVEAPPASSLAEARRNLIQAIDDVAMLLRNTRAICRKCYVHPGIMNSYLEGSLRMSLRRTRHRRKALTRADESSLLAFLRTLRRNPAASTVGSSEN